jgi:hypothetical protein
LTLKRPETGEAVGASIAAEIAWHSYVLTGVDQVIILQRV